MTSEVISLKSTILVLVLNIINPSHVTMHSPALQLQETLSLCSG